MDAANGVQRSGSGASRGGKGGRGQMRGLCLSVLQLYDTHKYVSHNISSACLGTSLLQWVFVLLFGVCVAHIV